MNIFKSSRARLKKALRSPQAGNGVAESLQLADSQPVSSTSGPTSTNGTGSLANDGSHNRGLFSNRQPMHYDYWMEAYIKLREKERSLVEHFETIVQSDHKEFGGTNGSREDIPKLMEAVVSRRLNLWQKERWRFRLGNKQIHLSKQIDGVIKNALKTKEFLFAVGQVDPVHVGLPLAGVCLLLSLAGIEIEQRATLLGGLTIITELINFYVAVDKVYFDERGNIASGVDVKSVLVDLYVLVLNFQMCALRYFQQAKAAHLHGGTFNRRNDWMEMLDRVKESDERCRSYIGLANSERLKTTIDKQFAKLNDKLEESTQDTLLRECFRCFSILDYQTIKDEIATRVPGTCEWVQHHPHYVSWLNEPERRLLWITADAGCGKTVLAKALIDEYFLNLGMTLSDNVCYFFFKDEDSKTRNPAAAISTFLHQLFTQEPSLLEHAKPYFSRHGNELSERLSELWRLFLEVTALSDAERTICVIDALDECSEDMQASMIRLLNGVCSEPANHPKLKFLITSQPRISATGSLFGINVASELRLWGEHVEEKRTISQEIHYFIKYKIERFRKLREACEIHDNAHELIESRMNEIDNRTYLWVSLVFLELQKNAHTASKKLERSLDQLPSTVERYYERILSRCRDIHRTKKVLQIIVMAARPLDLTELNVSLALAEATNAEEMILEPENTFERMLKASCGSSKTPKSTSFMRRQENSYCILPLQHLVMQESGNIR